MILYTHIITPRLRYVVDFISKEFQADPIYITSSLQEFEQHPAIKINYSDQRITQNELWIKPQGLLFEKEIKPQYIECFDSNNNKAFFKTDGDLPFDVFAASFYLLSRYAFEPTPDLAWSIRQHLDELLHRDNITVRLQHAAEKLAYFWSNLYQHQRDESLAPTAAPSSGLN